MTDTAAGATGGAAPSTGAPGAAGAAAPFLLEGAGGEKPFNAAGIERELRGMWKSAAPSRGALYRAALANVIVPCDPALNAPLDPVLIELTRRHPSRLFRLERLMSGGGPLMARASALCHMRPGGGGRICSEQIVLFAPPSAQHLAPSAIASLLIGDVPVILLYVSTACEVTEWHALEEMADMILEDSAMHDDVASMTTVWRRIIAHGSSRARDIAWARVTPWRELLAEAFDQPAAAGAIANMRDVTIHHGGAVPPAGAWLLAAWLASRLGWAPRDRRGTSYRFDASGRIATVTFKRDPDQPAAVVTSVRLRAVKPRPLDLVVSHQGRAPSARIEFVAPIAVTLERAFHYREFAPCLIGEMHRHEASAALDAAAPVALSLAGMELGA